jgi:hypothetical protein
MILWVISIILAIITLYLIWLIADSPDIIYYLMWLVLLAGCVWGLTMVFHMALEALIS